MMTKVLSSKSRQLFKEGQNLSRFNNPSADLSTARHVFILPFSADVYISALRNANLLPSGRVSFPYESFQLVCLCYSYAVLCFNTEYLSIMAEFFKTSGLPTSMVKLLAAIPRFGSFVILGVNVFYKFSAADEAYIKTLFTNTDLLSCAFSELAQFFRSSGFVPVTPPLDQKDMKIVTPKHFFTMEKESETVSFDDSTRTVPQYFILPSSKPNCSRKYYSTPRVYSCPPALKNGSFDFVYDLKTPSESVDPYLHYKKEIEHTKNAVILDGFKDFDSISKNLKLNYNSVDYSYTMDPSTLSVLSIVPILQDSAVLVSAKSLFGVKVFERFNNRLDLITALGNVAAIVMQPKASELKDLSNFEIRGKNINEAKGAVASSPITAEQLKDLFKEMNSQKSKQGSDNAGEFGKGETGKDANGGSPRKARKRDVSAESYNSKHRKLLNGLNHLTSSHSGFRFVNRN